MATDDIFDSGPQNVGGGQGYGRSKSREFTPEELVEMQRAARKEGKRDIILSQLVEQQAETVNSFRQIETRLTRGDGQIARLAEEHKQTLEALQKVGKQAEGATAAINNHMTQCDERWNYMKKQFDHAALERKTDRTTKQGLVLQNILVNVLSGVIVLVVVGGILAYTVLPKMIEKQVSPPPTSSTP